MIVVDVETTGTDPDVHAIVSIGAVDVADPTRQFYRECRIWDGARVQDEALAVNGFTHEQVVDASKPSAEETTAQFIAWCKESDDRTLGGHNTAFDRDFLQASADRHNLAWHFGNRVLDLHSVAYAMLTRYGQEVPRKNSRSGLSLDAILPLIGLPQEPKPHNGLVGAQFEAGAFSRFLYGTNLLAEFARYPVPPWLSGTPIISDQRALF